MSKSSIYSNIVKKIEWKNTLSDQTIHAGWVSEYWAFSISEGDNECIVILNGVFDRLRLQKKEYKDLKTAKKAVEKAYNQYVIDFIETFTNVDEVKSQYRKSVINKIS